MVTQLSPSDTDPRINSIESPPEEKPKRKIKTASPSPNQEQAATKEDLKRIRQGLNFFFLGLAGVVSRIDETDSHIIVSKSPDCIDAWVRLAERDEGVRKFLLSGLSGSPYLEVVLTTAAMVIPILANHGFLPALGEKPDTKVNGSS